MLLNVLETGRAEPSRGEPGKASGRDDRRLEALWAARPGEIRSAQRLRYRVFAEEMGARLATPAGAGERLDVDRFDPFCEHLLVRAVDERKGKPAKVVGTYRVLTPDAARRAGGFYSETEFDLDPVRPLLGKAVELGRSCVHPRWRSGAVVMTLWGALGEFMLRNGLDTMVGCASIGMADGGHTAASLWARLRETHMAPPQWRVTPHLPLPVADLRQDLDAEVPALIKGYLRCGAMVLGPPAWDPEFNTADLPLLMRFETLPARYKRHFLGA